MQKNNPEVKIYNQYLFNNYVQPKTGLSINIDERNYFKVDFRKKPIFNSDFFTDDDGIFPLIEKDSSYHMKFRDCEPHNYETISKLDISKKVYICSYFCDGELYDQKTIPMKSIFSANRRIEDLSILNLFSLCESNIDELKKNVIIETRQRNEEEIYWRMANNTEQRAKLCSCSGWAKWYQIYLYWDGKEIFKKCKGCNKKEKLI